MRRTSTRRTCSTRNGRIGWIGWKRAVAVVLVGGTLASGAAPVAAAPGLQAGLPVSPAVAPTAPAILEASRPPESPLLPQDLILPFTALGPHWMSVDGEGLGEFRDERGHMYLATYGNEELLQAANFSVSVAEDEAHAETLVGLTAWAFYDEGAAVERVPGFGDGLAVRMWGVVNTPRSGGDLATAQYVFRVRNVYAWVGAIANPEMHEIEPAALMEQLNTRALEHALLQLQHLQAHLGGEGRVV